MDRLDTTVCVRVWLMGPFLVERRGKDGNWEPIASAAWDRASYARLLLKRLLSAPERRVDRSTLIEDLWPHLASSESVERYPGDAAYQLRKVLGIPHLLKTFGTNSGYELADQNVICLDIDAAEALLKEAEQLGRTTPAALPLLEQAQSYFQRGEALEGQAGTWCHARRATVERMRYRCCIWLGQTYEQQGHSGQAEQVYSRLLEDDPADEDAFCLLLSLLHRQGLSGQVRRAYQQTQQQVQHMGLSLSRATEQFVKRLLDHPRSLEHLEATSQKLTLRQETESDEIVNRREAQDVPEASHPEPGHSELATLAIINDSLLNMRTLETLLSSKQAEAPELVAAHLLSLSGKQLAVLNRFGWTQQDILSTLQIVLQGETAMAKMNRRQFVHLGAGLLLLSGIDIPTREHPSLEERTQLMKTLGEGIAASWTLFHLSGPEQVLAVARTQLGLVQQNYADIYPIVLSMCYSGAYRLIGAACHFQGRYDEAHKAHEKAYLAALEGGDSWNMAQSRSWQAYGWRATGNYADALLATDAALRLVSEQHTIESIRLQARLFAFAAQNAALMGDAHGTETRLRASEQLLEYLPTSHEEFDHVGWLQEAGACALILRRYDVATVYLRQALQELPPQWSLRFVSTAIPLSKALIHMGELDEALTIVQRTAPVAASLRAVTLIREFTNLLEIDLLPKVASDKKRQAVVIEAKQQLA